MIEQDADLKTLLSPQHMLVVDGQPITFQQYLQSGNTPQFHDYSRNRTQTIADAIAQVIAMLDFTALGRKSKKTQEIIFRTLFPNIALPYLSLQNADRMTDFDLDTLLRTSHETLHTLDLIGCNNITRKGLAGISRMATPPTVILRHCSRITAKDVEELRAQGMKIRMTDSQSDIKFQPRVCLFIFVSPFLFLSLSLPPPPYTFILAALLLIVSTSNLLSPSQMSPIPCSLSLNFSVCLLPSLSSYSLLSESSDEKQLKEIFGILANMDPSEIKLHRNFVRSRATVNESLHSAVTASVPNLVKVPLFSPCYLLPLFPSSPVPLFSLPSLTLRFSQI